MHCPLDNNCGMLNTCVDGICVHDGLFSGWYQVMVYLLCPILVGTGMVGGLGGGILKGPVLIMLLNYSIKEATFISYCIMFGGCLINTIYVMRDKHPIENKRPIINYDISIIFNCAISLGTYFGSVLNIFLPAFYVTIFQEIFLLPIIIYLVEKGRAEKKKKVEVAHELLGSIQGPYLEYQERNTLVIEYEQYPSLHLTIIWVFFFVTQLITTGGYQLKHYVSLPNCFDIKYLLLAILIMVNIPMTYYVFKLGKRFESAKKDKYFEGQHFMMIYLSGLLAGFVSGFIGLGAGLVMVPVLLKLGVHPQVASSTSAFNYFFIGLTGLLKLLTDDLLTYGQIAWFVFLSLIGGGVIAKIGYYIVAKYKIAYIVIYIVVGLAVLNFIAGIEYIIVQSKIFGFNSLTEFTNIC